MRSDQQPNMTASLIQGFVSQGTYAKGKTYQASGRVLQLEVGEDRPGLWLVLASVHGSSGKRYSTVISCTQQPNGTLLPISSDCSCPVNMRCKHAAAVLLELLEHPELFHAAQPDWRAGIRALLPQEDAFSSSSGAAKIALLFEIKQQRHGGHYYSSRVTNETFLSVRIGSPSPATGKWALNQYSWQDVVGGSRKVGRIALHQRELLRTLWSLYVADARDHSYDYYGGNSMLKLDHFSNPRLWKLLDEAEEAGIPLLTAVDGNPPVERDRICLLELAVSERQNGNLQLAPRLLVDGTPAPKGQKLRFIGNPPTGVYWSHGPVSKQKKHVVHIARFATVPDAFLLKAYQEKAFLDIPSQDKEEFSKQYFPQIARRTPVNAAQVKSIKLDTPPPPKLYVSVSRVEPQDVKARLGFAYQNGDKQVLVPYHAGSSTEIIRDKAAERALIEHLADQINHDPAWYEESTDSTGVVVRSLRPTVILRGLDAVRFMQQTVAALSEADGTIVHLDADVPKYQELTGAPTISYGVSRRDDGSQDWFNLEVEVTVGDVTIPFEPLFTALADNEESLVLGDGSYLLLTHPELLQLRQLITEARQLRDIESNGDGLELSRFQAGLWEELQRIGIVKAQTEAWETAVRGLLDIKSIEKAAVPKDLNAKLRPYQKNGYQWLRFLWSHKLGGILADDMGLGKTLQTIALILAMKSATPAKGRTPVLIIAPTSVAANWQHELAHFAPTLNVMYVQSVTGGMKPFAEQIPHTDVVLSSYALFRLDFDAYAQLEWSALILDEAQFVKNHQSKGYQNARRLPAGFKLALTGTPLENNLMELWALLSIVAPGLFPSPKRFSEFYQKPIEREADRDKLQQLRQRVRPLMLRRTKEQVATELPPKTEQVIELELEPKHRKVYDTHLQRERQRVLGMLGDVNKNRFMIFKSLTMLRLLSLAPALVDAKKYKSIPSTKLQALVKQLQELASEGHRVLVFSQFTSFLKMVQPELNANSIDYKYLDGATKNRAQLLEDFKSSNTPVFLISLKAGGFGLNLTEADYCILLDPWWNPAVERQAVDRAHRIGQTKHVMVYRLVAKDTIEEKVMALKAKKAKLFASMLDDDKGAFSNQLTTEDIQQLFE